MLTRVAAQIRVAAPKGVVAPNVGVYIPMPLYLRKRKIKNHTENEHPPGIGAQCILLANAFCCMAPAGNS
jgi:hypothetical protein